METPKVFISHASEDKTRFVLDLDKRLRAQGIDVWLDKREILAGDNLVDKIFEEGIKKTQAVIVVLSQYSIEKPWPKAERDVSVIKKINENIRLIPLILDIQDEEVPESLKPYRWVRVKDLNDYEDELNEIINSIYEHREKPPLGEPPKYAQTRIELIPDLTKLDNLVLKLSCERLIEQGYAHLIEGEEIFEAVQPFEIDFNAMMESLEILDRRNLIDLKKFLGSNSEGAKGFCFHVTEWGMDAYLKAYREDYESIFKSTVASIVNKNGGDNFSIASHLNVPEVIIDHVITHLKWEKYIKAEYVGGGQIYIYEVNPELKRWLQNNR
ncbi:molecular chaperone Tir [candidate division TA06 bacterium B3_TA06]|uniref:Molecular chaperone Tir n=1 Tax=candidate division TA06 bacterium B3_TA06 TaxID=2012487 RepID=A0A532UZJ4_UNCT6|nr:MAG: molecular chaperone Tir [candidate division TA06 bacterium B3_TA06]